MCGFLQLPRALFLDYFIIISSVIASGITVSSIIVSPTYYRASTGTGIGIMTVILVSLGEEEVSQD